MMARYNRIALRDNGSKILSIRSVSKKSLSCNKPAKRTRKVDSFKLDGSATIKLVNTVSKNSKCASVKLSCCKFRQGSGKNSVGTVDQVICERKIFTSVAKMPSEIQTKLVKNGWIGKTTANGDDSTVVSLHSNAERIKAVVKRYEPGLVWIDEYSGGINWKTLDPNIVVNRFPRNANAALKLCGHALVGKSEFDVHYPRAYSANTDGLYSDCSFVADYSLTACVSLLRAFVDGGHRAMCAKTGEAPLSSLHFAAIKCHEYLSNGRSLRATIFPGKGDGWETFFEHYYMIVHDQKKFIVSGTGDDVDAALCYLIDSSRLIVNQMMAARPQTVMDGYKNIWIVKDAVAQRRRPVMLNKLGDVLGRCARASKANIVQKYIETPLLRDNFKSDVYTWIVLSTLNGKLTVWLHRMCAVQPYPHGFSLYQNSDKSGHFNRLKSGRLHGMLRSTALIYSLKQLGAKMRRGKKMNNVQKRMNDDGEDNNDVYTAVKRSVVSAVKASVAYGTLNLRPNCLELFRGTFVLGNDSKPWLIDIMSDDPCLAADHKERGRVAPTATRVARSVIRGVGMILVDRGRGLATRIGMFNKVDECPMPSGPGSYTPQLFTPSKSLVRKTHRPQRTVIRASHGDYVDDCVQYHWWNDDNIQTYVEMITADDVMQDEEKTPSLADDEDLNDEDQDLYDPYESRRCLKLLDKRKTKIASIQKICKTIIGQNRKNKMHYNASRSLN